MRNLETRCYFEPSRNGAAAPGEGGPPSRHGSRPGQDEDDSGPGLDGIPASVLQRHGARVLCPADAAVVPGWPTPRSTVYRAKTLLVPADLLAEPAIGAIDKALARVGLRLVPPRTDRDRGSRRRLPRTAVLVPAAPPDGQAALPVVVDAWVALQTLRAAATAPDEAGPDEAALDIEAVRRISLEHLLVGSAITGSPITESSGLAGSPITESSGLAGPAPAGSYLFASGDARTPVEVSMEAPPRMSAPDCEAAYGRRPVVAVLDTGVRAHRWLDVRADPAAPGGYATIPDGFVAVDEAMQDIIFTDAELAVLAGDASRQLIESPWDKPISQAPLIGELNSTTGHGTFIAGIVRQVVPDARVLAVRIMHSDGIVNEGDLISALGLLAEQIEAAEEGDLAAMVDVLSLSLGYFSESAADEIYSSGLWIVIDMLLAMGVLVVAAAGNFSTTRKFYPAAFAERAGGPAHAPLISVGALNPNGSKALFSDGGRWVTAWAAGAAVVSTFPPDINGSLDPEISMPAHPANTVPAGWSLPAERESFDPDNFGSGFAIWSGTSFSAPQLAAQIVKQLLAGAVADPALRLDQPGAAAARDRVTVALDRLGWEP